MLIKMNIAGIKVILKGGAITEVKDHDNHLHVIVEGKEKLFNYETAFKSGGLVAVDQKIQKAIMEDIAKSEKLKIEQKNSSVYEEKLHRVDSTKFTKEKNNSSNRDSSKVIPIGKQLISLKLYGTKAQDIYDECCIVLGFNALDRGKFGAQQLLHATNATKEGYSVWFIAHSNWTETDNDKWRNEIFNGIKNIDEKWNNPKLNRYGEESEMRLTFAKRKNQGYFFLGIYKCLFINNEKQIKRYEIISDKYPVD